MVKRITVTAIALLTLTFGTVAVAGPASAETPCNSSSQVARIPRYRGNGQWQARMTCNDAYRQNSHGDVNIGHQNLTGGVCLWKVWIGAHLYPLYCGYGYQVTTYLPGGLQIATGVQVVPDGYLFSSSTWT